MIITIAGYKGGIGKTTTAVHLAAFFQTNAPPLFIDADENRSAQAWARQNKLPFEVTSENQAPKRIMALKPEHIIIDTKARPSPEDLEEISQNCDLLILPSTTRPMDLEVLIKTVQTIKELRAPYSVLLTMVPPMATRMFTEINAFVEQLPLDGTLAKDAKDENALKVWNQYMSVGQEIIE